MKIAGSVVFVTGGAAGIGHGICESVLSKGGSVGFVDLNSKQIESVTLKWRTQYGVDRVWSGVCDVTDSTSLENAIRSTVQYFGGRLNVVINNAGIVRYVTLRLYVLRESVLYGFAVCSFVVVSVVIGLSLTDVTSMDGMGWDGMGWDGMGWDGMEWMECVVVCCCCGCCGCCL